MSQQLEIPMRMLGRTGVKVSLIGLGGWHLGFKQIDEAPASCPFQSDMKAEGIAVTSTRGNAISVVIVFDNDNSVTRKPSKLQFAEFKFK